MSSPEHVGRVVLEWVGKADNDLTAARHTLTLGKTCPTDVVCFHAQQAVEKYLKAILVWRDLPFPRTHDVAHLVGLLPEADRPNLSSEQQDRLTDYAAVTRYPGNYPQIPLTEARAAVRLARTVRSHAPRLVPKAVLRARGS